MSTPSKSKQSEKPAPKVEKKEFAFETTKPVQFSINGETFKGTKFTFDSEATAEDRKSMLQASYGKDIIK